MTTTCTKNLKPKEYTDQCIKRIIYDEFQLKTKRNNANSNTNSNTDKKETEVKQIQAFVNH